MQNGWTLTSKFSKILNAWEKTELYPISLNPLLKNLLIRKIAPNDKMPKTRGILNNRLKLTTDEKGIENCHKIL